MWKLECGFACYLLLKWDGKHWNASLIRCHLAMNNYFATGNVSKSFKKLEIVETVTLFPTLAAWLQQSVWTIKMLNPWTESLLWTDFVVLCQTQEGGRTASPEIASFSFYFPEKLQGWGRAEEWMTCVPSNHKVSGTPQSLRGMLVIYYLQYQQTLNFQIPNSNYVWRHFRGHKQNKEQSPKRFPPMIL